MPTPEGKVKDAIKKALHANSVYPFMDIATGKVTEYEGFYYMPVAGPFSVHGVHDFVGCWNGVFWSIETKAPGNGEDATYHQDCFNIAVNGTGGVGIVGARSAAIVAELKRLVYARANTFAGVNI